MFLQDDNGKVWLYYISDINIRELKSSLTKPFWMTEDLFKSENSSSEFKVEHKYLSVLDQHLESKREILKENSVLAKQTLSDAMYSNFEEIKDHVGIAESPYYSSEDERINDKAFRELCPGNKSKMRDFLLGRNQSNQPRVQTAIVKSRKKKRLKTAKGKRQYAICSEYDDKFSQKVSNISTDKIRILNINKSDRFRDDHIKEVHKMYQIKRLGNGKFKKNYNAE